MLEAVAGCDRSACGTAAGPSPLRAFRGESPSVPQSHTAVAVVAAKGRSKERSLPTALCAEARSVLHLVLLNFLAAAAVT
jgi:hypothetical protein